MRAEFNTKTQRGKGANPGLSNLKEGSANWHAPNSSSQLVCCMLLFPCGFAPLRLCVECLLHGYGYNVQTVSETRLSGKDGDVQ